MQIELHVRPNSTPAFPDYVTVINSKECDGVIMTYTIEVQYNIHPEVTRWMLNERAITSYIVL